MRRLFVLAALLFALPTHAVVMEWVTVGDPGNAADTEVMECCGSSIGTTGYGAVAYAYQISKHEVTNAQYAEFLNAVAATDTHDLYNTSMSNDSGGSYGGITRSGTPGSYSYTPINGRGNMPVNYVSFYDALRFANWLHNGQGSGDTETGAYTITADGITNNSITRNADATIFLTSEDEWYKAAYFNTTSYFDYPARTDTRIVCELPGATPNTANCGNFLCDLSDVGSYTGSASPYGTFDQAGNVAEWNEAIIDSQRGLRGEAFNATWFYLAAWYRDFTIPSFESYDVGFRVATAPAGWLPDCDDGLDSDADGFTDYPDDPGCSDADDVSERSPDLVCDDGVDNDGDGRIDFDPATHADPGDQFTPPAGSGDPGCINPSYFTESPACQDGIDNDGDGKMDYDAGLSANGSVDPAGPDSRCVGSPWVNIEAPPTCGLGAELALLLPPLIWMWRRRVWGTLNA